MSSILNDFRGLGVPFSLNLSPGVGWKDNDARNTFAYCNNYNAPFTIPSDVMNCYGMFNNCSNLNSPIHIDPYGSVNAMDFMFYNCAKYQYDINIPVGCNSWYSLVNGYRDDNYNYQEYNGNIHVYTNNYQYGQGNFAWAFYSMYGFNGNVIFHDISPTSMPYTFEHDYRLNQNILLPDSVQNLYMCFGYCGNLNQNIKIPSNAQNCYEMFYYCENLNQNIKIPNGVDAYEMFTYCNNFNQSIQLPSQSRITRIFSSCNNLNKPFSIPYYTTEYYPDYVYGNAENAYGWNGDTAVTNCNGALIFYGCSNFNAPVSFDSGIEALMNTFAGCYNFNQNVIMPSNLKFADGTFSSCYMSFNQNISFPEGTIEMQETFGSCTNFNQNIRIPSTVKQLSRCFTGCHNLNYNIQIPSGCVNTSGMFYYCGGLNQNIVLPSSVKDISNMFRECYDYSAPTVIPEGVSDCSYVFDGCRNYYVDEAVIPSTIKEGDYGGAFRETKVVNVNVLTHNSYSTSVISLANAINTSGKTPSGVHYEDLPWTHADWQSFDFGTPIGHYKIPNDVCDDGYWQYSRIRDILGGLEYTSFESYQHAKETMQDESYWPQYNHGGLFHYRFQDEGIWHEAVYYKDYPNATSEEDTDWYFYNVIHY